MMREIWKNILKQIKKGRIVNEEIHLISNEKIREGLPTKVWTEMWWLGFPLLFFVFIQLLGIAHLVVGLCIL